jgi:hypothetical protein
VIDYKKSLKESYLNRNQDLEKGDNNFTLKELIKRV